MSEYGPVPATFVAATWKVYALPISKSMSDSVFVTPSVSWVEHCVPKQDFTTYAVMTDPPSDVGAPQETSTPPVASGSDFTLVGTPGTVRGVTASEGAESSPGPAVFTATTLKK